MIKKLLLGVSLFIFFIILLFGLLVRYFTTPVIKKQLDTFIENNDSPYYTYSYSDIEVRLGRGIASIEEPKIILKDGALEYVEDGSVQDLESFEGRSIDMDFDLGAYIFGRRVIVEDIKIIDPKIKIYSIPGKESEETEEREPLVFEEIFSNMFRGLNLESFSLRNASIDLVDVSSDESIHTLDSLNINFEDVIIDSLTLVNEPLGMSFDRIKIETGALELNLNEYYLVKNDKILLELDYDESDKVQKAQLDVQNLRYHPTLAGLQAVKAGEIRSLSYIELGEFSIADFNVDKLMKKTLHIKELKIDNPYFKQVVNTNVSKKARRNPAKPVLSNLLEEIELDKLDIVSGTLSIQDINDEESEVQVGNVDISFSNLHLDDQFKDEPLYGTFTTGVVAMQDIKTELDAFYSLSIKSGMVDLKSGDIDYEGISISTRFGEDEFFDTLGFETDRLTVDIGHLGIEKLDLGALATSTSVVAKSVSVDKVNLDVYRNKWIEDPEFKYKPLPSQVVRNLPIPIFIDTVFINNSAITYRQRGDLVQYENEKPMEIRLWRMNAKMYTFTNDKQYLQEHPNLNLKATTYLMDTALLTANYSFDINNPNDRFTVSGDLDFIHTSSLEPVLHNVLLVEIPDGKIYSGQFVMSGTDSLITGTLDLEYEDLNVDILKAKQPDKSSGFLNSVANTVIRKNNMTSRGKYIQGIVNAPRKKNKSVFNYSWQGIKSGIVYIVSPVRTKKMKGSTPKNKNDKARDKDKE